MENHVKTLLVEFGFGEEIDRVEKGQCPYCGVFVNVDEFRDARSLAEFELTGLCQACMDEIYGEVNHVESDVE